MQNYSSEENKQRVLDALERCHETARRQKAERIEKYNEDPSKCQQCGNQLPYEKRKNKFCCRSCNAQFNNPKKTKKRFCLNCGKLLNWRKEKYCCLKCFHFIKSKEKNLKREEDYKNGLLDDQAARKHYVKINGDKKCSICGLYEWQEKPIPLVVDHIDGNHTNNFPSNLRYVCCNCDAQLPTYKAKNKGNGRMHRRKK